MSGKIKDITNENDDIDCEGRDGPPEPKKNELKRTYSNALLLSNNSKTIKSSMTFK